MTYYISVGFLQILATFRISNCIPVINFSHIVLWYCVCLEPKKNFNYVASLYTRQRKLRLYESAVRVRQPTSHTSRRVVCVQAILASVSGMFRGGRRFIRKAFLLVLQTTFLKLNSFHTVYVSGISFIIFYVVKYICSLQHLNLL